MLSYVNMILVQHFKKLLSYFQITWFINIIQTCTWCYLYHYYWVTIMAS